MITERSLAAIAVALLLTAVARGDGELLRNGSFEGDYTDGIAAGWADNSRSWADLDVHYQREQVSQHRGDACQRIRCPRLDYGAVQLIPTEPIPLAAGRIYRVSAWLRGDVGPVAFQLRQSPSPYHVYVEKAAHANDRWERVEYFYTSNVDDPSARLMIRFTNEGTLWVDDVSVQILTEQEAAAAIEAPRTGNLLRNGQFDLRLANWLISHGCDYWQAAKMTVQNLDGNPCLRLRVPEGVHVTLASDVVPVSPGHPIYFSCRLRASTPTEVNAGTKHCGVRAKLDTNWQTVSAVGKTRFAPETIDYISFRILGPSTVWIDDVQLWQDDAGDGAANFQAAIVADRHPLAYYHDGDDPVLHLMASTPASSPLTPVRWSIEDFWGEVRRSGQWSPPGTGRTEMQIETSDLGRGWYRASVHWQGDAPGVHQCTFAILPPPERSSDAAASPFGAHFSLDADGLAIARAVGVRWLRLHPPNHTKWRVVEPYVKGEWAWRDQPIAVAKEAGLLLMGSLDRCPTWASTAPPGTADHSFYTGRGAWLPKDWKDWEEYVARTVRRYKNDIHVWEVWNEPNLTNWLVPRTGQTRAEAYVEMLRHTYPIVKRENPQATVIAGCVAGAHHEGSPARKFTWDIIDGGALELMDAFSFHQYITQSVDETREPIELWINAIRDKMRQSGRVLPIFNSEGGYANPGTCIPYRPSPADTVSAEEMARWLVRQYVSQLALGVRQFYFYNFFIDGSPVIRPWQGFLEGDGQPRPNVAVYAQMTWILDGARFLRTERPTEDTWIHHFLTPRGNVAVIWAKTETAVDLDFAGATQAWNLMGSPVTLPPDGKVTVTDAPIYIRR